MRSTLSHLILASAISAAAALTANTAMAETSTVNLPFSFTVAGKTCPPGHYFVERNDAAKLVTLKSADSSRSFSWVAAPAQSAAASDSLTLKFDRQGQDRVLRSIQYGPLVVSKPAKQAKVAADAPEPNAAGQ